MGPLSFAGHLLERRGSILPSRTATRTLAFFVILSGAISLLYSFYQTVGDWMSHGNLLEGHFTAEGEPLPPLLLHYYEAEERLPQHDENLPFPEGRNGRFLRFGNQMWGIGFNNHLQEILLNSHVAWLAGRAYVFQPYTWDHFSPEPYVKIDHKYAHLPTASEYRPAKVPLTAFLNSPTSGAPWPKEDPTPRAVSNAWFDKICPEHERHQVNTTEVNEILGIDFLGSDGIEIVTKWAKYLRELDAPCVNILWGTPRMIDFELLGQPRLISIWDSYSKSPVVTKFQWSPLVLKAVERNIPILSPPRNLVEMLSARTKNFIPGLVTLHVRRMDYEAHCSWMAGWSLFEGWSMLPFLPDRYVPPPSKAERIPAAVSHCWIEADTIVSRLRQIREEHRIRHAHSSFGGPQLDRVYISTNGDKDWIRKLKEMLRADGWVNIATTPDIKLSWEENGVDNAIDMELASRGEIFIGNGFSSFTSTIVRLRLGRNLPPENTRFW